MDANTARKDPSEPESRAVGSVHTLGERMTQEAYRIASRRLPVLPWLSALEPVFARVTVLPLPVGARFQRIEAAPVDLNAPADRLPEEQESQGQLLEADLRARLEKLLGSALPAVRIHADEAADRLSRAHRADAVAVGQDVYFRQNYFRPRQDAGFALLAHEATHVLQAMRPDASWKRATQAGVSEQEREASANEHRASLEARGSSLPNLAGPANRLERYDARQVERAPLLAAAPLASSSTAARPMTAASNRGSEASTPTNVMPNFEELRSALYRDLMSQIKADFERGG
jgi:hypothetical protein